MKLVKKDKVRIVEDNPELVKVLKGAGYVEDKPAPKEPEFKAAKKSSKKSKK